MHVTRAISCFAEYSERMKDLSLENRPLHAVHLEADKSASDLVRLGLELLGISMVSWEDRKDDTVYFDEYFGTEQEALGRQAAITKQLADWLPGTGWRIEVRLIAACDWQEEWKRFFHTERVSERIVVKPSWEDFQGSAADCVVEIDPGFSFGTGGHATTRACLKFLDASAKSSPGSSFLDIGCGSGILSIAAAKLGLRSVTGIDKDDAAIKTTIENATRNHVAGNLHCLLADLSALQLDRRFDIVAANILAGPLCRFAPGILATLSEQQGSRLLLAGILTSQHESVCEVYEKLGLRKIDSITENEWTSSCFERTG